MTTPRGLGSRLPASLIRSAVALVTVIGLAGCTPEGSPPEPPASEGIVKAPPVLADLPEEQRTPDLFGAWLVEAIAAPSALPQDRTWEMVLLAGVRQIEVLSQCVTIGPFDYGRTAGGGIAVRHAAASPRQGLSATPPQCARALSPAEATIGPMLLGASEVKRGSGGIVTVSGPKGSIILRRPDGALANPRGQAPPPLVPPPLGAWRFVRVNGRPLAAGQEMELLLRPAWLEWRSGCVIEVRTLRHEANRLVPGEADPFPVCERGRSEAERAAQQLFGSAVGIAMAPDGGLRLNGSGVLAELEPLVR